MITYSDICTEFDTITVGTKVLEIDAFHDALRWAVDDQAPSGQEVITLDDYFARPLEDVVSAGVGKGTDHPDDYVIRKYRGKVGMYLKRRFAASPKSCRAVVYTRDAYLDDPDTDEEEAKRIKESECSYVLVSVLADAGNESPLTPGRLVRNLAGGNNAVDDWTKEDIIEKAQEAVKHYDKWHVVAD